MKSVRLEGNRKVSIVAVDDPTPGEGEVVIRTAVSALCGSELHGWREDGMPEGNSGHEAVGTVIAAGPNVTTPAIGQRVGVCTVSGCGTCDYCAKGQYTWCEQRSYYGSMHAEQFLASAHACHVLPDNLSWEAGVLLTGDGFGVPYHSNTKITPSETETVAILGMGPIGLGHALLQSFLGRQVIAVDIVPYRLALASKLGAAHTVNATEADVVERIKKLTAGRGVDVCVEAAGRPETAKQCFSAVRTAGLVLFSGEQSSVELSPSEDFIRRDITATGAWFYHFSEITPMLELYRKGLRVDALITHHFDLASAAEAYATFAKGETGKVILHA